MWWSNNDFFIIFIWSDKLLKSPTVRNPGRRFFIVVVCCDIVSATIRPILCGKPFATKSPISYGSTTLTTVGLLGLLLMSQSASHTCAYTNILCTVMDVVHHAQTSRRVVEAVCRWGKETVALNPIDVKKTFFTFFLFRARFLRFLFFQRFYF